MGTKGRCYLLYTGQHYDPLVGADSEDARVDDEVRVFADKVSLAGGLWLSRIRCKKEQETIQKKTPLNC